MKKFLLFVMLTMSLTAWGAVGSIFTVGDLEYWVGAEPASSDAYGLVHCNGLSSAGKAKSSLSITIPYIVTYNNAKYYVKTVEETAFQNSTNITSVRFTYGIEEIRKNAFLNCSNLTTVRLPSSIKTLGATCFAGCSKLTTVYYAGNAQSITTYSNAFSSHSSRTLYVPYGTDDATVRSKGAFSAANFSTIKHAKSAYDYLMSDGTMFVVTKRSTSTSTPHECTIIGVNTSASGVTDGKFYPSPEVYPLGQDCIFKFTAISDSAFLGETGLKNLDLSRATDIATLGESAVAKCTALTSVNLGNVNTIKSNAFRDCTALTTLSIPASVTDIDSNDFVNGCTALKSITVNSSNPYYSSDNSGLYDKNKTTLYRIPEGYPYADLKITPTATTIDRYALFRVNNVRNIILPYGLKNISAYAFSSCYNLKKVYIPATVNKIGYYAFFYCNALTDVYINNTTPINITKSDVFERAANCNLHVPHYCVNKYKQAGWTDFLSYNKNDEIARDYSAGFLDYTIASTKSVTINGTTCDGECMVVRSGEYTSVSGVTNIPPYIEINGKKYAVTEIDESAFGTTHQFSITGCANVGSVGYNAFFETSIQSIELPYVKNIAAQAFAGCSSLTSVKWGNNLYCIYYSAFEGCTNFAQDVIFPVGFHGFNEKAFARTKVTKILLPSTTTLYSRDLDGMSSLQQLICNSDKCFAADKTFYFEDVPTTCKVLVPVGYKATAQAHPSWSRFSNIEEGAFDFGYNGSLTSDYTMTVTSTDPVTVDGVTYDGKAKYVYNSRIQSMTGYSADNCETDKMCGGERKYLMTEIGDSCFYGSNVTSVYFYKMKSLQRIGNYAFYGSKLKSAEIETPITIGSNAFTNAADLTEIVIKDENFTVDSKFFGNNAADFTLYVPNEKLRKTFLKLKNYSYSRSQYCDERVSSWIEPSNTTFNLGALVPLDFSGSDFKAYSIDQPANLTTGIIPTTQYTKTSAGRGFILTDLEPGRMYKLKRQFISGSTSSTYLKALNEDTDLSTIANSYLWDCRNNKFVKVTDEDWAMSGESYLVMPGGASELYLDIVAGGGTAKGGDVNGDGTIDIADVNIVINVMLGKASASSYPAADVNNDGTVDIADVNIVINLMLGKNK